MSLVSEQKSIPNHNQTWTRTLRGLGPIRVTLPYHICHIFG